MRKRKKVVYYDVMLPEKKSNKSVEISKYFFQIFLAVGYSWA